MLFSYFFKMSSGLGLETWDPTNIYGSKAQINPIYFGSNNTLFGSRLPYWRDFAFFLQNSTSHFSVRLELFWRNVKHLNRTIKLIMKKRVYGFSILILFFNLLITFSHGKSSSLSLLVSFRFLQFFVLATLYRSYIDFESNPFWGYMQNHCLAHMYVFWGGG